MSEPFRLGQEQVSILLETMNTEVKCAVLGNLSTELPVSDIDLHGRIDQYDGFRVVGAVPPSQLGEIATKFPDAISVTSRDEVTKVRQTQKQNPAGVFATAMAGSLLGLSLDTNTSLRALVGESRRLAEPDGTTSDALLNRLVLLGSMVMLAGNGRWVDEMKLRETCAEMGTSEKCVTGGVRRLNDARLVERRRHRSGKKIEIRFKPEGTYSDPVSITKQYLQILDLFTIGDTEAIEAGHNRMEQIITDRIRLPYLLKRSFASTKHFGKKSPRSS